MIEHGNGYLGRALTVAEDVCEYRGPDGAARGSRALHVTWLGQALEQIVGQVDEVEGSDVPHKGDRLEQVSLCRRHCQTLKVSFGDCWRWLARWQRIRGRERSESRGWLGEAYLSH